MCGRFGLSRPEKLDPRKYGVRAFPAMAPRYNIAPGSDIVAVRERSQGREAGLLRWGLIPWWSQGPATVSRTVNARADTAWDKPAYRDPMAKRRCLIPADFFYEWQVVPGRRAKQPYAVALASGASFALGGLWDFWRPRDGSSEGIASCAVLTTEPNAVIRPIHDRMPVIIPDRAFDAWLDPSRSRDEINLLIRPIPAELLRAWPVGLRVNSATEDDAELLAPIPTER